MKYEYPIIPASSGPLWLLAVISLFMLALVGLFSYLAWSSRFASFEVSPAGLRIRGDVYGRMIPAADLQPAAARTLDLTQDTEFVPKLRTNGAGLPGYSSGWFNLRNGEKALLFVTDRRRVVYVPTRRGYAVMMSTAEPQSMVTALQSVLANSTSDK